MSNKEERAIIVSIVILFIIVVVLYLCQDNLRNYNKELQEENFKLRQENELLKKAIIEERRKEVNGDAETSNNESH